MSYGGDSDDEPAMGSPSLNSDPVREGLLSGVSPLPDKKDREGRVGGCKCSPWVISTTIVAVCIFAALVVLIIATFLIVHFSLKARPGPPAPTPITGKTVWEFLGQTNVYCGYSCTQLCMGSTTQDCFVTCYDGCNSAMGSGHAQEAGVFSKYLMPNIVQHVGVTVKNLTRVVSFFVEMLGGVEVIGAGGDGFQGDGLQYLLTQKELIDLKGETLPQMQVADLYGNGTDLLNVRFVNFGNLQIEVLEYKPRDGEEPSSNLPFYHHSTSPTIVTNMHLSLRVRVDVDVNAFLNDFERRSVERGYTEVRCNRLVYAKDEAERRQIGILHPEFNSMAITAGPFRGLTFGYCKGVENIQLEFNLVTSEAKREFDEAFLTYLKRTPKEKI